MENRFDEFVCLYTQIGHELAEDYSSYPVLKHIALLLVVRFRSLGQFRLWWKWTS